MPMLIARRKAKSAVFIALYQAEKNLPSAHVSVDGTKDGSISVILQVAGKVTNHRVPGLP
ncbi:MAG: hypothetical protein NTU88_13110 [Armatimonadetes bacterium]|nr:hypothetical protein [Armatimonadota bacterium]